MATDTKSRRVVRPNRFKPGYDPETDTRRSKVNGVQKTHTPLLSGMILDFVLPNEFRATDTKGGKGLDGAIPYQEYQVAIGGGYILINSFLGEEAAGKSTLCVAKIGLKTIKNDGKTFEVPYLKLEPTNATELTHEVIIAKNGLVLDDAKKDDENTIVDFQGYNENMSGGLIVKPIAA